MGPFSDIRTHIEQLVVDGEVPSITVDAAGGSQILWEEGVGLADRE